MNLETINEVFPLLSMPTSGFFDYLIIIYAFQLLKPGQDTDLYSKSNGFLKKS